MTRQSAGGSDGESPPFRSHRGRVVHVTGGAAIGEARIHLREIADARLDVDPQGRILALQPFSPPPPGVPLTDHGGSVLLPGFVDTHVHFPQVYSQARGPGWELLDWLDRCIFPDEARLADPRFAEQAAADFVEALVRSGTTAALIHGSQFPAAQEALFRSIQRRGLRAVAGRTSQTRGPEAARPLLADLPATLRLIEEEVDAWHRPADQDGRIQVAVIPRFPLSFDGDGLRSLADLYEHLRPKGVYFSTHLSEDNRPLDGECALVKKTLGVPRYLDAFDRSFLGRGSGKGPTFLGRRSIFAHAVHCEDGEYLRLAETSSTISHCPVSQLFLGSGTMPLRRVLGAGVRVAAGSDAAAGDSFFVPGVLNAAYKVHRSRPGGVLLSGAELLYLGTLAGAQALDLADRIGSLLPGRDATFLVVDTDRDPLLRQRLLLLDDRGADVDERLFTLLMSLRPAMISRCVIQGEDRLSRDCHD